ncbi:hypothetical protein [Echinicola strongylocentroti]|nr:hypothetical protein [Echinicola strongylocentroti]
MEIDSYGKSIETVERILRQLKKGKAAPDEILKMTKTANGELKGCLKKIEFLEKELNKWVDSSLL